MTRIFDGLYVDQLFHKNERGETIYYPNGMIGRGYLLPEAREAGVRKATRRLMACSIVLGILFALIPLRYLNANPVTWLIGGAAFALLLGVITYVQSRIAAGLEPLSARIAAGEWLRRGRQARAPWTYWICLALGLPFIALSAAGFADGTAAGLASGAVMLAIGALLAWDGAMGLLERSRTSKAG